LAKLTTYVPIRCSRRFLRVSVLMKAWISVGLHSSGHDNTPIKFRLRKDWIERSPKPIITIHKLTSLDYAHRMRA